MRLHMAQSARRETKECQLAALQPDPGRRPHRATPHDRGEATTSVRLRGRLARRRVPPRNRMREHCTSGTVRGVTGNRHSYRRDAFVERYRMRMSDLLPEAGAPEHVNDFETPRAHMSCGRSSRAPAGRGGLIHPASGRPGGCGGRWTPRSGWTLEALSKTCWRACKPPDACRACTISGVRSARAV